MSDSPEAQSIDHDEFEFQRQREELLERAANYSQLLHSATDIFIGARAPLGKRSTCGSNEFHEESLRSHLSRMEEEANGNVTVPALYWTTKVKSAERLGSSLDDSA
jgi:hypothetical protein